MALRNQLSDMFAKMGKESPRRERGRYKWVPMTQADGTIVKGSDGNQVLTQQWVRPEDEVAPGPSTGQVGPPMGGMPMGGSAQDTMAPTPPMDPILNSPGNPNMGLPMRAPQMGPNVNSPGNPNMPMPRGIGAPSQLVRPQIQTGAGQPQMPNTVTNQPNVNPPINPDFLQLMPITTQGQGAPQTDFPAYVPNTVTGGRPQEAPVGGSILPQIMRMLGLG